MTIARLTFVPLVLAVFMNSGFAATLVSRPDPDSGAVGIAGSAGIAYSVGWSQSEAHQNVSITAPLFYAGNFAGSTSGNFRAFLSTSVGPGATAIASQAISVPATVTPPITYTLFAGLTLGPGNYYLTIAAVDTLSNPGWSTSGASIVVGPGITYLGQGVALGANLSTPFQSVGSGGATPLQFTIRGDRMLVVPTLSTSGLLALGTLLAVVALRLQRASACA
jgi:hypothetical protein